MFIAQQHLSRKRRTSMSNVKETDEQLEIINASPKERTVVMAVPGSGKTHTMANRVVSLLKQGKIKPEEIVLFSYTNNASQEIAERVVKNLGTPDAIEKIKWGTIHSFCFNECQTYTGIEATRVLDDYESMLLYENSLIHEILNNEVDEHIPSIDRENFKKIVRELNNNIENTGISVSLLDNYLSVDRIRNAINLQLDEGVKPIDDLVSEARVTIAEDYLQQILVDGFLSIMLAQGVYTFQTMVLLFNQILNDPTHYAYVSALSDRFKYLCVDELQDLKDEEVSVINKLSEIIGASLFCGDIAQTIYSSYINKIIVEEILTLESPYTVRNLTTCFRMSKNITHFTNRSRSHIYTKAFVNPDRFHPTVQTGVAVTPSKDKVDGPPVNIHFWADPIDNDHTMMRRINTWIAARCTEGSVAILASTNRAVRNLWSASKGLFGSKTFSTDFYNFYQDVAFNRINFTAILYLMMLITGTNVSGSSPIMQSRIMQLARGRLRRNQDLINRTIALDFAKKRYGLMIRSLFKVSSNLSDDGVSERVNRALSYLCHQQTSSLAVQDRMLNIINMEPIDAALMLMSAEDDGLQEVTSYFQSAIPILKDLASRPPAKIEEIIDRVIKGVHNKEMDDRRKGTITNICRKSLMHTVNRLVGGTFHPNKFMMGKERVSKNAGIYLDTIHSAKGLEFDNVNIVTSCVRPLDWNWDDGKCLAYVGMTRARTQLNLHFYEKKQNTRGGMPSGWFSSILAQILHENDIDSFVRFIDNYVPTVMDTFVGTDRSRNYKESAARFLNQIRNNQLKIFINNQELTFVNNLKEEIA